MMQDGSGVGVGVGLGVARGIGVGVGAGVAVGATVGVAVGLGMGLAVDSRAAVAVGLGVGARGVAVARCGAVGAGVAPAACGAVAAGVGPDGGSVGAVCLGSAAVPIPEPVSLVGGGPLGVPVADVPLCDVSVGPVDVVGPTAGPLVCRATCSTAGAGLPAVSTATPCHSTREGAGTMLLKRRITATAMASPRTAPIAVCRDNESSDLMGHLRAGRIRALPSPRVDEDTPFGWVGRQPATVPFGPNPAAGIGSKSRPSAPRSHARAFSPSEGRW